RKVRTVGETRAVCIDELYLLALEHGDVGKLADSVDAPVLDHQQSGFDIFKYKPQTRNRARRSPDVKFITLSLVVMPNAEMNSRPLDCGRELCQHLRRQRQTLIEHQRLAHPVRRKKCQ